MGILSWIIFGLIAGGVADYLSPDAKFGLVGSILLGIAGAVVGGFLGEKLLGVGVSGFNFSSFVVAIIGALIVLYVGKVISKR